MNIYYFGILSVYIFGFFYGRWSMLPLKELMSEEKNKKLAERILINVPKIFVICLFLKKRDRVSVIAIIYQIIWYILFVRTIYIVFGTCYDSFEHMARIVIDPLLMNMLFNVSADYIVFKLDRRK